MRSLILILCEWFHILRKWRPDLMHQEVPFSCSFLRHSSTQAQECSPIINKHAPGTLPRTPKKQGKKAQVIYPYVISRSYFKEENK